MSVVLWFSGASRAVKAAVVFGLLEFGGTIGSFLDRWNVALNLVGVALLLWVAARAGRSKARDDTIKTLQDEVAAQRGLLEARTEELSQARLSCRNIEQAAGMLKEQLAAADARYEEQSRYTAPEALSAVMKVLEGTDMGHERRHQEIMAALSTVERAVAR